MSQTSHDLKAEMLAHALYRLHFVAAVTECGNGSFGVADVVGIRESGYTAEFEVKVSKQDLMGEMKSIRAIVEGVDLFADPSKKVNVAKYPKHNAYIKNDGYMSAYYKDLSMRPNHFYFVVPPELKEVALEGLAGTPYGLFMVYEHQGEHPYSDVSCLKKPSLLHKEKASDRLRQQILHKACTELQQTRSELARGRRCKEWSCRKPLGLRCPSCEEIEQKRRERTREYRKENEARWKEQEAKT